MCSRVPNIAGSRCSSASSATLLAVPIGPPLSALSPGAEYYNGVPRAGYIVTPGPGYGPERSYAYPSAQIYRSARVVRPVMPCATTAP